MLTKCILAGICATLVAIAAPAQEATLASEPKGGIAMPEYRVGDKWVYQGINLWNKEVVWKLEQVVENVEVPNVVFRYKYLSSSDPAILAGSSGTMGYLVNVQSNRRSDLLSGIFENVRFPLSEGMTWTHSLKRRYSEGDVIEGEYTAKVVGWEDVKVPAGIFRTLKIEHSGRWRRPEKGWSGREENTVWYSPDAKRNVQALHIDYDIRGNLHDQFETQLTQYELVSPKVP